MVVPEVGGVVAVRWALAVVPDKLVEAFAVWVATGAHHAKPPLAEGARNIASLLQQLGEGLNGIGQRLLAFGLYFLVATDVGMAGVLPGKERGARRGAYRGAGVKLGEAHDLGRETVEIGGEDMLLAIYPEVAITQVIREDEHDVGPLLRVWYQW